MNEDDKYDFLHKHAERHYERAELNIAEHIKNEARKRSSASPPIRLLDIGSGKKSALLKALEQAFEKLASINPDQIAADACNFEIHLLDIKSFEGQIFGQSSPYRITTGGLSEQEYQGIKFMAKFIKLDFNEEIGTERKDAETDSEYESEITGPFDVILLNFVIHEILDSCCLEFTNSSGETESLTTTRFLEILFKKIHELLADGAMVYFGDAYFPKYITSQQTKKILSYIEPKFGHADAPALFLHPEDIVKTITQELKEKFELHMDTERLTVIDQNSGLFRKSYFIGLKKLQKTNEK